VPNHCTNRIVVRTKGTNFDAREIVKELADFNKLVPMPPEFKNIASGGKPFPGLENPDDYHLRKDGGAPYARLWWDKEDRPLTKKEFAELQEKYGCVGWYDWSVIYWGTKWNAYNYEDLGGTVGQARCQFTTAWSPPEPVLQALVNKYPGIRVLNNWYEEGCGRGNDEYAADEDAYDLLTSDNKEMVSRMNAAFHTTKG